MVLLLWIFVVYNRSRWILAFASFLLLAQIAAVSTILAKSFSNFRGLSLSSSYCRTLLTEAQPRLICCPWSLFVSWFMNHRSFTYFGLQSWLTILLYLSCSFWRDGQFTIEEDDENSWAPVCSKPFIKILWSISSRKSSIPLSLNLAVFQFYRIFAAYLSCAVMWLAADVSINRQLFNQFYTDRNRAALLGSGSGWVCLVLVDHKLHSIALKHTTSILYTRRVWFTHINTARLHLRSWG